MFSRVLEGTEELGDRDVGLSYMLSREQSLVDGVDVKKRIRAHAEIVEDTHNMAG